MRTTVEVDFYGLPLSVTGEYDAGEKEWFNHAEGVGGPGHPPSFDTESISVVGCPAADAETLIGCVWFKTGTLKFDVGTNVLERLVADKIHSEGI